MHWVGNDEDVSLGVTGCCCGAGECFFTYWSLFVCSFC